jgi:hypothetical protein
MGLEIGEERCPTFYSLNMTLFCHASRDVHGKVDLYAERVLLYTFADVFADSKTPF